MSSNYPYDPYASAIDPSYSPDTGVTDISAEYARLRKLGYTDAQTKAMLYNYTGDPTAQTQARASAGGGASAPTWAQLQGAAQDAQAQSNWQENYMVNKARGDQQMQLQQAQLELEKQKYLASLHGPQDYIAYWRASRGFPQGASAAPTGAPTGAPAWAAAPAAAAAPSGLINLPQSTTSKTAYAAPSWATGVTGAPLAQRTGIGNSTFDKGTVLGVGDSGVPISLSDWSVQNLKRVPS